MEDVYTIKVKTKPDTRNLYPSERRYSASTVSGLAWVHIALAATSFLLACLALVNPIERTTDVNGDRLTNSSRTLNDSQFEFLNGADNLSESEFDEKKINDYQYEINHNGYLSLSNHSEFVNHNVSDSTDSKFKFDSVYMLVLAPSLITIFGVAAGVASFFASVRWYVDHNITWMFIMSTLSTIVSSLCLVMIITWFAATAGGNNTMLPDDDPHKEYFVVKHTDVVVRNGSHMIIALKTPLEKEEAPNVFTKHVLSINILIAAFLELLWSILSVKISYKGMRNTYKEDVERRGNRISVVTKIKGNDTRKMPRNKQNKPELIETHPSRKIKRIFLAQSDNGFYLKSQQHKTKPNTETSSEIYKERMLNFLNRCASLEAVSNPEMRTPSVQSEAVLNPIPEAASVDIESSPERAARVTPVSWGDTPDHTVYNQNTLNLNNIFNFKPNCVKSVSGGE